MTQPQQVGERVYRISVPQLTHEPTNVYLIVDRELALIDFGYPCEEARQVLDQGLAKLGYALKDISMVLYTHPHVDHMGGGALLPKGMMHHVAYGALQGRIEDYGKFISTWRDRPKKFAELFPEETLTLMDEQSENFSDAYFQIGGEIHLDRGIWDGDLIDLGKTKLEVLHTPGHSPDHVGYYDRQSGLYFSGDFILGNGPALVSMTGDNIDDFLNSLDKVQCLPISCILPAHGDLLLNPVAAIENSRHMIRRHELRVLGALEERGRRIFGIARDFMNGKNVDPHMIGLGVGIVLTHLERYERMGAVKGERSGKGILFSLTDKGAERLADLRQ
ncbi:MAG: MBL fold metallo-hydrolase [Bacillota bacterium]